MIYSLKYFLIKFSMLSASEKEYAIQDFVKILQFETVSGIGPNGSYNACANWLLEKCAGLGADISMILPESLPKKPIVISTWLGSDPTLPCILLNSHYDVVPVMEDHWTVPAFEGLRKDGRVYGRGAQDMKSVCVQYLTALKKLKSTNFTPLRTIHLSFVPDEEVTGRDGMEILLRSNWFKSINIGLALDEGLASETDSYSVFYGERMVWWAKIQAQGNTGHGSRFIEGTAVEMIMNVANKALVFRQEQKDILHGVGKHAGCSHGVAAKKVLGDVTSLNITKLHAGVSSGGQDVYNVVPAAAEAAFDIRVSPHVQPEDMAQTIDTWCREARADASGPADDTAVSVSWEFVEGSRDSEHAVTKAEGPWWDLFTSTLTTALSTDIVPLVFPAATDSRFLRLVGVRAFGFSPIRRSPILLHEHDEYLDESVFLEGCDVYVILIQAISSMSRCSDDGSINE